MSKFLVVTAVFTRLSEFYHVHCTIKNEQKRWEIPFKAAKSVTFDLLILELMFLFFKNTVKKLKFMYTFYQFRKF